MTHDFNPIISFWSPQRLAFIDVPKAAEAPKGPEAQSDKPKLGAEYEEATREKGTETLNKERLADLKLVLKEEKNEYARAIMDKLDKAGAATASPDKFNAMMDLVNDIRDNQGDPLKMVTLIGHFEENLNAAMAKMPKETEKMATLKIDQKETVESALKDSLAGIDMNRIVNETPLNAPVPSIDDARLAEADLNATSRMGGLAGEAAMAQVEFGASPLGNEAVAKTTPAAAETNPEDLASAVANADVEGNLLTVDMDRIINEADAKTSKPASAAIAEAEPMPEPPTKEK